VPEIEPKLCNPETQVLPSRAEITLLVVEPDDPMLTDERERFKLLVEGVKDYAILMLDPDGMIVSWNSGAERIKGYTAKEAIGRHFSIFYTPEAGDRGHPEYELAIARVRAATRRRTGACAATAHASGPAS
jgi:PAS domain-containing protein